MDWYKFAENIYDDPEYVSRGYGAGEFKVTSKALKILAAALMLIVTNHMVRLFSGNIAWTGWAEVDAGGQIRASLPTPAGPGDEIVIKYNLNGPGQNAITSRPIILISCLCSSTIWKDFRIDSQSEGEITMPVIDKDFYQVKIVHPISENIVGNYYWGVRKIAVR